ncbi:MAG: SRPBCC domain-containing protein, partial [Flavobacteriia bacterium]|nr:SRPBCC domain-containing protein [Flavobacteriia bacterium]
DDSEEQARMILNKSNERIRFRWIHGEVDDEEYYFEFKIVVDEITKDVSLVVSDFADEDEIEESKLLWDNLISDLKQVLGSA